MLPKAVAITRRQARAWERRLTALPQPLALASNMALPIARRPGGARTSASKRGTWVVFRVPGLGFGYLQMQGEDRLPGENAEDVG